MAQTFTLDAALRDGPEALFALLAKRLQASVGHDLLTLLAVAPDGTRLVRPFTDKPAEYPLGDADVVENSPWFHHVFTKQLPFIANSNDEILAMLPEFTSAATMGYGSLLNYPVIVSGRVVGLINLMGPAGLFDPVRVAAIAAEVPLAALGLLARYTSLPTVVFPAV